ncbi:MAG: hypothetical protein GX640_17270 [Fibrobacter sp.]|nr:hypothetical protein [Fibrobacter sp.]
MLKHFFKIISEFLNEKQTTLSKIEREEVQYIGKNFIRIPSLQFFGRYSVSSNKDWIIAWSDSDSATGTGGYRESGKGSYVLIHNSKPCIIGKLERPSLAKVADNGTFIINDIMFGDNLASVLIIFDNCGNEIIKHRFEAKMFSTGLSECGQYAACQLCFSESEDSGQMALFSLEQRNVLWKARPYPEWVESFDFRLNERLIVNCYSNGRKYKIHLDGSPLETEIYEEDTISNGDLFSAIELLQKRVSVAMEKGNDKVIYNNRSRFLELVPRAKNADKAYSAKIYRYIGEIDEYLKDFSKAIANYEMAINYDPKIGVKRKLQALKKITKA